ncbi:MAG TPA: YdcF family protein [Ilumatobacter sp.]|jgi:uncharacterized SAM-binding protein YcdF (DUF218 family)|nr:YdcF family protein [Ilumatobacter sp.]
MTDETQIATAEDGVIDPGPEAPDRSHGWTWKRWVLACVAGVLAVLLLYYVVTLIQVVRAGRQTDPSPAEAIVVLGAAQYDGRPSPQLAARLDHALELYEQGVAPVVMVTGGNQPGDRFTEAEASAEYLVDRGVPETAIMREDEGRTTYESLDAAADQLRDAGLDEVVLVTDPYHSLRSRLIAEEVGLDADLSPTPTSVVTGWSSFRRELAEAGGVAIGRIIGFDRLSDLTG